MAGLLQLQAMHRPSGPVFLVPEMLSLASWASQEPPLLSKVSRERRCRYPEGPGNTEELCCEAPLKELQISPRSAAGKRQRLI